jgi:hypothetical protein
MFKTDHNVDTKSLNCWLAIALFSLFSANVIAILLVLMKLPVFSTFSFESLFRPLLAYHVNLAMVFWLPTVACWLWASLFSIPKNKVKLAFTLSLMALILFIVSLVDAKELVTLSNYYPILHSTIFVCSLALQVVAVSVLVLAVVKCTDNGSSVLFLAKSAAYVWLILLVAIVNNFIMVIMEGDQLTSVEQMLWAPGHIQQTINSFLIATMWSSFLNDDKVSPLLRIICWLTICSCAFALVASFVFSDEGMAKEVFTWQMSLFSWLPMALVLFTVIREQINNKYITLSVVVALLGIFSGMLITPGTLSIPGHYHGMTGAFNLAFFAILLAQRETVKKYQNSMTMLYGAGLIMLILGLTWAGWLGIGRKLIAQTQGELDVWQSMALSSVAFGALLAVGVSGYIIASFFPKMRSLSLVHKG